MKEQEPDYDPFTYPSPEERKAIIKSQPLINNLFFDFDKSDKEFTDFTQYKNAHDLDTWKNRFNNKVRKLVFSYVLTRYHFDKDIPDEIWKQDLDSGATMFLPYLRSERDKSNLFLFRYSSEHYYYHYMSASDIVYHLLNVYYDLEVKQNTQFSSNVAARLKGKTAELLADFKEKIKLFRFDRNDLTHNFPFNEIDTRSKKEVEDGRVIYTMGGYDYKTSKEALLSIEASIKPLADLVKGLNQEIK